MKYAKENNPFKIILHMIGSGHVADLTIEYLSACDMGPLIKTFEACIPGVRIVFFTTKPPGQPGSDNAIGVLGLSLVQAMLAESLLRAQEHDYLAQYGTTRFFRLEPGLALWHTLTGERDAPDRWDTTLLSEITSPRHLAMVSTTTDTTSHE